jgi:single-strand DNA-binding protein
MSGMANVTVSGYLGGDAELKSVGSDQVCNFSIAVTTKIKDKEITAWYRAALWGKRGQTLVQYLKKGSHVTICGPLHVREFEHAGAARYSLDVRVNEIDLGPKREQQQQTQAHDLSEEPAF